MIREMPHDPSYSAVLEGYISLLDVLQEYVTYSIAGDSQKMNHSYNEYVSLLETVRLRLAAAFERNHVKYVLTDERFTYYYYSR